MEKKGGAQGVNRVKNVEVKRVYEPDMEAMVRALRIVLEKRDKQKDQKEERRYA